jgi:hypothetical protein
MDLDQASRRRNLAGWAGTLFFLLAFLALIDGIIAGFREPANVIKLLPGMTAEINGEVQEEIRGVQDLTYLSDADDLKVTITALHKGYFMGGDMWRGQITVGPRIQPGEYHLTVVPRQSASSRATPAFRIVVFADPLSLQHSSKALVRRYTGWSSWAAAAACLPGILLAFGALLLISQKIDRLLARQGRAEIYRVLRKDGVFEIHFGLGTEHGVRPGLELQVFNPKGKSVGLARVEEARPADGIALMTSDQEIRAGFFISKEG